MSKQFITKALSIDCVISWAYISSRLRLLIIDFHQVHAPIKFPIKINKKFI